MAKRVGPFGHKQRRGRKKPGNPLLQSETLESRDLLTITLAFNEPYVQEGWPNNEYPVIGIVERFGDISQSLEVSLANSDPSEVSIPDSITIPANESSASFQVEILDDNELDGLQFAAITATAGPDSFEEVILIEDYETGQLQIDQGLATPGGTVSGNVSTSAIGPLSITIRSSRPDEVAPFSVEIPAGQSTANFVVPVSENGITQGPHEITLSFDSTSGLSGNFRRFAVADPGLTTVLPIDDGFATDADRDGVDFEVLNTGYSGILIRSEDNFPYNAVRSMVEYDMSAVPANADITEAVWGISGYSNTVNTKVDVFAYNGNGVIESSDAMETNTLAGSLTLPNSHMPGFAVPLDTNLIQSYVDNQSTLGFTAKIDEVFSGPRKSISYYTTNNSATFRWPSLHLQLASSNSTILANALTVAEGQTKTLSASDLAATDPDVDDTALTFSVSDVHHGEFLLNGSPATSFTQADINAGSVSFAHDHSEIPPAYVVHVNDGTHNYGPSGAAISFSNIEDQPPNLVTGQEFDVVGNAPNGLELGQLKATDGDIPAETPTFAIVGGNTNGTFGIQPDGTLFVANRSGLSSTSTFSLDVVVTDSSGSDADVVIVNVESSGALDSLDFDFTEISENEVQTRMGTITRSGDVSSPMNASLFSSDTSELIVPNSVEIPAGQSSANFPVTIVDDNLLDGEQQVSVTATSNSGSVSGIATVLDYESIDVTFDFLAGTGPKAVVTVSNTDRSQPVTINLTTSRPDELYIPPITIPAGQQSAEGLVDIFEDSLPEGFRSARIDALPQAGYTEGGQYTTYLQPDTDVSNHFPISNGQFTTSATGESFDLNVPDIRLVSNFFAESKGVLFYDISDVPDNADLQSAVLTFDTVNMAAPELIEVYTYVTNTTVVQPGDADLGTDPSFLFAGGIEPTYGEDRLAGYPVVLDLNKISSILAEPGLDTMAFVLVLTGPNGDETFIGTGVNSEPVPTLGLYYTYSSELLQNNLQVEEGGATTITTSDLFASTSASDVDVSFLVENLQHGQFLLDSGTGTFTTVDAFTQADVIAGNIIFEHDNSEFVPSYDIRLDVDDAYQIDHDPVAANVVFTFINDETPIIMPGQNATINEDAANGTVIDQVVATDADLNYGNSLDFSIVGGNTNGTFDITSDGQLSVANNSDLGDSSQHVLSIVITDGLNSSSEDYTVNVNLIPAATLDSLTTFESTVQENHGTFSARVERTGGSLSDPLTVLLSSSDTTELSVPASVVIPANQSFAYFTVTVLGDTLLDGDQNVTITASTGSEVQTADVIVEDYEYVSLTGVDTTVSSGELLTGTATLTVSGHTEPIRVVFTSSRPDEIPATTVEFAPGQSSQPFAIPVLADSLPEGPHSVTLYVDYEDPVRVNYKTVTVSDPGVMTIGASADGYARDTDGDQSSFESRSTTGSIWHGAVRVSPEQFERRGIVEFDISALPDGAIIQSAVYSIFNSTFSSGPDTAGQSIEVDVFGYQGNNSISTSDALEVNNLVGDYSFYENGSIGVLLDTSAIQALVDGGDSIGIVTAVNESMDGHGRTFAYESSETFTSAKRPALNLVYTTNEAPTLLQNSLTVDEGATVTLTSNDLSANDPNGDSLTFTVSSVSGGEFLLNGLSASTFSADDVNQGNVDFVHDDGEQAPAYQVSVSDGLETAGPSTATITFTNVNDNAPTIPTGQSFAINEDAVIGALVGRVVFNDTDLPGDSLTAAIVDGNSAGLFAIDNNGDISVSAELDHEMTASHSLTVEIGDGANTSSESVTVNVGDVNDVAPTLTSNSLTVSEGESVILDNGNLAAQDADSSLLTFTTISVSGGEFIVGGVVVTNFTNAQIAGGEVSFQHDDSEQAPAYDVAVSDGDLYSSAEAASITFTNVNDNAPSIPAGQEFSLPEDASNGLALGTVSFSDSDVPGDSLAASIIGGNSGGIFAISTAGSLTVANNSNLDFESASSHTLTIQVTDGLNTTSQAVVVNVTDVPEGSATKFYVVDTSTDDMFEYAADGSLEVSYNLGSGNNAPRGATTTAAGDTIWVIDNDDWVYRYDADGNLTSKWKASGLRYPEGIATDGTDIWIADRGYDRVYKFTDGASFTSGTRSPNSSFPLHSNNRNPRGVTTDGTHMWVVNGTGGSDFVYKYNVSGSYLGRWKLTIPSGRPEGITIDPSNVDTIWIVDRSTDQVHQYTGGTNWTSGTRTADATFDLAPQNYHPRGIADPPPQTQPLVDSAQQHSLSLPAIAAARQTVRDAAVNRLFESAALDQDENQLDAILDLIFANQS